jgi:hypothetical protein
MHKVPRMAMISSSNHKLTTMISKETKKYNAQITSRPSHFLHLNPEAGGWRKSNSHLIEPVEGVLGISLKSSIFNTLYLLEEV